MFASLQLKPDVLIYVKRMAKWGWADEDEMNGNKLEELAALNSMNSSAPALRLEVRQYHREFRPHEVADIVFERLEGA